MAIAVGVGIRNGRRYERLHPQETCSLRPPSCHSDSRSAILVSRPTTTFPYRQHKPSPLFYPPSSTIHLLSPQPRGDARRRGSFRVPLVSDGDRNGARVLLFPSSERSPSRILQRCVSGSSICPRTIFTSLMKIDPMQRAELIFEM